MAEQYYGISFSDPGTPSYISAGKLYIGTLEEIRTVMNRLDEDDTYRNSVDAWKSFCAGNLKARHNAAHQNTQLLTPVEYVCSTQFSMGMWEWDHINIWDFPYHLRFKEARISQLVIRHEEKYRRCLRAWLTDLQYKDRDFGWLPLNDIFGGNAFLLDVNKTDDSHFILNNLLYIEEDFSGELSVYDDILLKPEKLLFDRFCDEIFGDG